ncbi:uncharacterized protein LOC126967439 [Leptidea sinapis]|uniref:uncharacterized protein LOC126967439 n=1 Tax=Leptidea sinapis TaxID=189913 RepID=UPI0021382630|nr:uncharacterized protein LOC126967439 [Leptidea sinapis]
MKDPFVNESFIDSPAKDSLSNIDGCYRKNFFNNKSFMNSRRALQTGAEKISKTFKSVRNTFDNLTQHFRVGGRRRHRLTETTSPCRTPATPVKKIRQIVGRSPTKLYSPFGIETPRNRDFRISPYMPNTPEHDISPKRRKGPRSWHLLAKKRPRALFQ